MKQKELILSNFKQKERFLAHFHDRLQLNTAKTSIFTLFHDKLSKNTLILSKKRLFYHIFMIFKQKEQILSKLQQKPSFLGIIGKNMLFFMIITAGYTKKEQFLRYFMIHYR